MNIVKWAPKPYSNYQGPYSSTLFNPKPSRVLAPETNSALNPQSKPTPNSRDARGAKPYLGDPKNLLFIGAIPYNSQAITSYFVGFFLLFCRVSSYFVGFSSYFVGFSSYFVGFGETGRETLKAQSQSPNTPPRSGPEPEPRHPPHAVE